MNELHLFAGAGGGILGGILLGHTCVCAVEIEPYCRKVLLQRQRDGILPRFPIWDDVRTFDGKPWRGGVDVVCGGFPCQDISVGSSTATGLLGERSGLYQQMRRVVGEIMPRYVLVENSPALLVRGIGTVLRDMAKMGYDCRWGVFSAGDVGARHERERLFILSDRDGFMGWPRSWSEQQHGQDEDVGEMHAEHACDHYRIWMEMARSVVREDDDVAGQVDRTRAIGNGQVPAVVKLAWETLTGTN
ncbi:MAG TPA: DNA cytosine methyltransferase [Nitrospiraceae bacterium]